jgi:hypothetical protein
MSGESMRSVLAVLLLTVGLVTGSKTWAQHAKATESTDPSLSITVSVRQDVVKIGTRAYIEVTTKNISTHETQISKSHGQLSFQMDVKDEESHSRPESELAQETRRKRRADPIGEQSLVTNHLKPGESDKEIADVRDYYDLSKIGKYTIQVHRLDPRSQTEIKSNTITITVTP